MSELLPTVPPFRTEAFNNYGEFERYLHASDTLRGSRWLYERSLASQAEWLVLKGTCGLCLHPTQFRISTVGGETVLGGRVPNWREGLACDCTLALINRERALLHFLFAKSLAEPWMRVLALGEVGALRLMLERSVESLDCMSGTIDATVKRAAQSPGGYHLIISVEQLDARQAEPPLLSNIARLLAPGGSFVFTTPFDTAPIPTPDGHVGWALLDQLVESGFATARACTYWSEELGYLGPFNFIFMAATP